jgi:glycosyltransferase involved in cell wall biosynthesis
VAGDQTLSLKRIASLPKWLFRVFVDHFVRGVYYVTDKADWSFYWDGFYITMGLRDCFGLRAQVTTSPWKLRRQVIHFGNRYAYLKGPFRRLHPSNKVFLTWFHGDPDDTSPETRWLFAVLPEASEYVQKIVVTCSISKQTLIGQGISEGKITMIPLGIDLSRFAPASAETRQAFRDRLGIPEDAICVGSFQKDGVGWQDGAEPKLIKGPDVFLDVIARLSARYPNIVVLLTGPSRGYVKDGLKKMKVPYIHHFLTDYHKIVRYYQALDLYVISSRFEGGPKALLESWATGVPVVSTAVGMAADLVKHGINGMLAQTEDVARLTGHAEALIENESLRAGCRQRALEDVTTYDWPLIAEQYYEKLYRPFMGNGKTPGGRRVNPGRTK